MGKSNILVKKNTLSGWADNFGSGAIGSVGAGSAKGAAGVESAGVKDTGFGFSFSISANFSAGSSYKKAFQNSVKRNYKVST